MYLYTIVPYEQIFPSDIHPPRTEHIRGGLIEISRESGQPRISRVISTDPRVYLKGEYTPGNLYTAAAQSRRSHNHGSSRSS